MALRSASHRLHHHRHCRRANRVHSGRRRRSTAGGPLRMSSRSARLVPLRRARQRILPRCPDADSTRPQATVPSHPIKCPRLRYTATALAASTTTKMPRITWPCEGQSTPSLSLYDIIVCFPPSPTCPTLINYSLSEFQEPIRELTRVNLLYDSVIIAWS